MRSYLPFAVILCLCFFIASPSKSQFTHGQLTITPDGHFLQYADNTPFFWLGDTGWELFHRLTLEEIRQYLNNRKAKGFNVIQAVVLAEFDGLRKPNRYGQLPFEGLDPLRPNESYFQLIDSVVKMAARRGIFLALLPTWGDKVTPSWGDGPVIFDSVNAYRYGAWIGHRYKNEPNIIWVLGGDRPAKTDNFDWTPVWRQMALGIREGVAHPCIISYHPSGGSRSTSQFLAGESWLDVNMFQSGHGGGHDVPCWELVYRDRNLQPVKPTLDAEPNYEDHPVNPWPKWDPANGYFRDYDVRKQCYRSVFAGACGVTYGHHAVWQFYSPREKKINYADRYWTLAIDRPGAFQVGYLRTLVESNAAWNRIPDTTMLLEGQGKKGDYATACRTPDNTLIMVYLPVGKRIVLNTTMLKPGTINRCWFNPRTNKYTKEVKQQNNGKLTLTPPETGLEKDWVLLLKNR